MKKYSVLTFLVGILALIPTVFASPVSLSVSAAGESSIVLSWTTDRDIVSHEVFYSTNILNDSNLSSAQSYGSMPISVPSTLQSITISGLNSDATYYFAYRFVDTVGDVSISYANVRTQSSSSRGGGTSAPLPVTNLVAVRDGADVAISWDTPNSLVLSQFEVAYATTQINNANFNSATKYVVLPLPVLATKQSVVIPNIPQNVSYYFAVRTVSVVGEFSPVATALISGGATDHVPAATNLVVVPSKNYIDLSWQTPQSNVLSQFDIRCSVSELTNANFVSSALINNAPLPISGTRQEIQINGLNPSTTYYCGVRNVSVVGELSPIAFISGTTKASGGNGIIGGNSGNFSGGGSLTTIGAPSIIINDGAEKTDRTLVTLTLSATNANEMMLSNSADFRDAKWEPYTTQTQWVLLWGDGGKTVYSKFKNSYSVTAGPVSDSIILETQVIPPPHQSQTNIPIIIIESKNPIIISNENRPYTTIISISPSAVYIPNEEKVVVVLTAHSGDTMKYGAHLELDYPSDILAVNTVDYGDGWVPEYESAYNYDNAISGRLIKTAKHDPFNGPIHFATVTFTIKKSGTGLFDTNSFSMLRELSEYKTGSYITQANTSVIDSSIGKTRLMFANLISLSTQDNTIAVSSAFIFLFLCYIAYVISMHRTGKRKFVLPLPLKRQD